jgi:hypothetical protein
MEGQKKPNIIHGPFAWGEGSAPSVPSADDEADFDSAVGGLSTAFVPRLKREGEEGELED